MNAYKMDFTTKTLTLTKVFSDACADPNSEEYKLLCSFQKDFPDLKIVRKTHKTPTKYRNSNGKITRRNQYKDLTFNRMERFIACLPKSEEKDAIQATYNFLRNEAVFPQKNKYAVIREWFVEQFPNYRENPLSCIYETPNVINISHLFQKKEEKDA